MKLKIAKEFRWEMSHRLPFHNGLCRNIHGHSYKLRLELEGKPDNNSIIIDYYDIDKIVQPFIETLDHSFICDENDIEVISFMKKMDLKFNIISNYTTVENIAGLILVELSREFRKFKNIDRIKVRVYESAETYAETELEI